MNVASFAVCQRLYELSGWDVDDSPWGSWMPDKDGTYELRGGSWYNKYPRIPAYDLGYVLRRLPRNFELRPIIGAQWEMQYQPGISNKEVIRQADTPEDAACLLAIELFQQGILYSH